MKGKTSTSSKRTIAEVLSFAGVQLDGPNPWDISVHDSRFYDRVLRGGSLPLGESYMDGWWDCQALDQFFFKILREQILKKIYRSRNMMFCGLKAMLINCQSRQRACEVAEKHYDVGNDLYEIMLDDHMAYSCAYWNDAVDLTAAQEAKMVMICRKLGLKPGMRLLDIGSGWGSFVRFAARHYGVEAVGLTVSTQQAELARQRCRNLPVDIRLQDYREVDEPFDAVVSVGMFEHVGYKNYSEFMKVARRCLKPEGLFLLHTIGTNQSVRHCDPWFDKYIFPNGMLPSISQVGRAVEKLFIMEDWHNIGVHYDKTLMSWFSHFDRGWEQISQKYGERFYRMWKYYLLSLAGGFRARTMQVWQIVFSPQGVSGDNGVIRRP